MKNSEIPAADRWPSLPWEQWKDTADTLHMWTQIVGKVRLSLSPMQQHWWNVPLYVSARGLTTSAMPVGLEFLEIEFDFVSHDLRFRLSNGATLSTPLRPQSVRDFYAEFQRSLVALDLNIAIHPVPVEVKDPIPFAEDTTHTAYDADAAHRFWRVLMAADRIFHQFSSSFIGKISPVHFFWAASISLCPASPAGPRRCGKGRTMSPWRPTPKKSSARAFGRGTAASDSQPSIPTPFQHRKDCPVPSSNPRRLRSTPLSESSSCPMKICAANPIPTPR